MGKTIIRNFRSAPSSDQQPGGAVHSGKKGIRNAPPAPLLDRSMAAKGGSMKGEKAINMKETKL